jgi:hypothetical protein
MLLLLKTYSKDNLLSQNLIYIIKFISDYYGNLSYSHSKFRLNYGILISIRSDSLSFSLIRLFNIIDR